MNLLLDTHALIWWLGEDPALGARARDAISDADNTVFVNAVSAFEVSTKSRLGKLPEADILARNFIAQVTLEGFEFLAISVAHGVMGGQLQGAHRDPFDRLLMAQAILEGMTLVSNERLFDQFGVSRLW